MMIKDLMKSLADSKLLIIEKIIIIFIYMYLAMNFYHSLLIHFYPKQFKKKYSLILFN
jgi:flagellar biosynthesis protein FliQ